MSTSGEDVLGQPLINFEEPFFSDKILGNRCESFCGLLFFGLEFITGVEESGTDEVLHLHVGLLVGEAAVKIKFQVIQSEEVFAAGLQSEGVFDQIDDPIEGH